MKERTLTMNIFFKTWISFREFIYRKLPVIERFFKRRNHKTYRHNGYIVYFSASKQKWFREPLAPDGSSGVERREYMRYSHGKPTNKPMETPPLW